MGHYHQHAVLQCQPSTSGGASLVHASEPYRYVLSTAPDPFVNSPCSREDLAKAPGSLFPAIISTPACFGETVCADGVAGCCLDGAAKCRRTGRVVCLRVPSILSRWLYPLSIILLATMRRAALGSIFRHRTGDVYVGAKLKWSVYGLFSSEAARNDRRPETGPLESLLMFLRF